MSVALAGVASQLTAFITSQDAIVGTTEKRITAGVSAVASVPFRDFELCSSLVVGCDLWTMEEVVDSCDVD